MESTSTICKIRNLEGLNIIIESETGEKTEMDLTDKCNLETREGLIKLREYLTKLTEITLSKESMQYRSVDIGFPIPMLQVCLLLWTIILKSEMREFYNLIDLNTFRDSLYTNKQCWHLLSELVCKSDVHIQLNKF